jgi:uncharacterized protein YbjT (DUF2867 family)
MSNEKVIAVIGATGSQGGALSNSILSDRSKGKFRCRAITRDPTKKNALALKSAGAEVVRADLDDVRSLVEAFDGAYGVFAVTNFWEHMSAEREKQQARNIADAARQAHVKHIVWSTLEDTRQFMPPTDTRMPFLQGAYRVPHLDCKNEANEYFKGLPTTFLITSFFWENLYNFQMCPKKVESGDYQWTMPMGDAKLAGHATADIGKAVHAIFGNGAEFIGKTAGIVSEAPTVHTMCDVLAREFDVAVQYNPVDPDIYRTFPFPGADEIGNNFQYFRDFNQEFLGFRSAELMRRLNPGPQSFADFVSAHRDQIWRAMNNA